MTRIGMRNANRCCLRFESVINLLITCYLMEIERLGELKCKINVEQLQTRAVEQNAADNCDKNKCENRTKKSNKLH